MCTTICIVMIFKTMLARRACIVNQVVSRWFKNLEFIGLPLEVQQETVARFF